MTYNWEHWGILRSCIAVSCLQWTSIASRGKQWCSLSLHAEETGIGSDWVDHLARGQTSAFITIVVSSNLEFFKVSKFIWLFLCLKGEAHREYQVVIIQALYQCTCRYKAYYFLVRVYIPRVAAAVRDFFGLGDTQCHYTYPEWLKIHRNVGF